MRPERRSPAAENQGTQVPDRTSGRKLAVFVCAVVLGFGVLTASAGAEGIVPMEGPWQATTSAGLPVSFEVSGGQVTNFLYRFKWGFCGTYIEATFTAPDRAEGVVVAPDRMLPGCPHTRRRSPPNRGPRPSRSPHWGNEVTHPTGRAFIGVGRYI